MRNFAAGLVAAICWTGLGIQFFHTYGFEHQIGLTSWVMARFFTVLTNLLVGVAMTWVAAGRRTSPELLGGVTISIIFVGLVYWVLLQKLHHPGGAAHIANILLHRAAPVGMSLWWLLFAPRNHLKWTAPWLWTIYPVSYFLYVLGRAQSDGVYPYPFIDIARIGWLQVAMNAAAIMLTFILGGFALVWIDSWLPLGSRRTNR